MPRFFQLEGFKSLQVGDGGVIDNKGDYVPQSGIDTAFGGKYDYVQPETTIDKSVVYLGPYIKQWGHYLLDSCSRLWYVLEHDDEVDYYVFLCVEHEDTECLTGNYLEFLQLLGIEHKVLLLNKPEKFSKVIIPDIGIRKAEFYSKEMGELFRKCANNIDINPENNRDNRIFMSRSKLHNVVENGNEEIDAFFSKNGFKIIYPERERLSNLIKIFQSASIVATISGSTAHNLVFTDKSTKCVIIERQAMANEYQVGMNLSCNILAEHIDANICLLPVSPGSGPFIVCCNQYLAQYAADNNMAFQKSSCVNKYVRNYLYRYFDTYYSYPPEWVVKDRYAVIKEAYEDAIREHGNNIVKIGLLQRIKYGILDLRNN